MDVGTAAVALNSLLGAATAITRSDVTNTSVANIQQNNKNFLNENSGLIKALDASKLNSLFNVNGNMITLKKDVIVEPLLVITESAFDSKECEKLANMSLDVFTVHYTDTFNTLQNVYGLDSQTVINVLGTDNGFNKVKGMVVNKAIEKTIETVSNLVHNSGLSTSFDELVGLEISASEEDESYDTETSVPQFKTVNGYARLTGNAADMVKNAKDGIVGQGMLERRVILKLRPYQYGNGVAARDKQGNPSDIPTRVNDNVKEAMFRSAGGEIKEIQIPITIKARLLKVTPENVAQVSEPHKKHNMLTTWLDVKAGLSTLTDYLLQREAVKKYKKNLLKGNEFLKTINDRKLSAYSKVATTSVVGFELNYTLMIMSQKDKQLLDRYLNLNIYKEAEKDDFLASVFALSCAVLDDDAEMVTFLTPQIRGINSVTYRELKKFSGQKENDVGELLMAMVKSRMLG